jgi:hypothetical protein
MSHSISDLPRVQPSPTEVTVTEATVKSSNPSSAGSATPSSTAVKLPYRATHQVELLHLHAEIEALLHQVQTQKHQRLVVPAGVGSSIATASEVPVLAIR